MKVREGSQGRVRFRVPLLYLAFAHLALAAAFLFVGHAPATFVGFFYHPQMMAPVHLVTLGWVTSSILGALYVLAPSVLERSLREGRLDRWGFWCFAIGVAGMAAHFWIDGYSGMLSSVPLVLFGVGVVGWRLARVLPEAPVGLGVRLSLGLAILNLLIAAGTGFLIGLGRYLPVLPGYVLSQVTAHAVLAIFGWGALAVLGLLAGVALRRRGGSESRGNRLVVAALLFEVGVVGLFIGLLFQWRGLGLTAGLAAVGIGAFVVELLRGLRRSGLPWRWPSDPGLVQLALAFVYLGLGTLLGLALLVVPLEATVRLRLLPVFGALILLGFLAQAVAGVADRLMVLAARQESADEREGWPVADPGFTRRRLALFLIWMLSVPLFAAGLYAESAIAVGGAAWLLFCAVALGVSIAVSALQRNRRSSGLAVETNNRSLGSKPRSGERGSSPPVS